MVHKHILVSGKSAQWCRKRHRKCNDVMKEISGPYIGRTYYTSRTNRHKRHHFSLNIYFHNHIFSADRSLSRIFLTVGWRPSPSFRIWDTVLFWLFAQLCILWSTVAMRLDDTVAGRLPGRCMTGTLIHMIVYSCCQGTSSVYIGL